MTSEEADVLDERFGDLNARLSAQSMLIKILVQVIEESAPGAAEKVREHIAFVAAEAERQSSPERQRVVADIAADALRIVGGI